MLKRGGGLTALLRFVYIYIYLWVQRDINIQRPGGMREAIRRPSRDGVLDHLIEVFLVLLLCLLGSEA